MGRTEKIIAATTFFIALASIAFGVVYFKYGIELYHYAVPIYLTIWSIGTWAHSPSIPFWQLILVAAILTIIHFLTEHLIAHSSVLWYFVSEFIVSLLCVRVFGAYWVHKGYIPGYRNFWPE